MSYRTKNNYYKNMGIQKSRKKQGKEVMKEKKKTAKMDRSKNFKQQNKTMRGLELTNLGV